MTDLIDRIAAWVHALFRPPGTHRRRTAAAPGAPSLAPLPFTLALPAHRSPYGLDRALLVGEASPLVRPYLTAHEQRGRRRELMLATLGLDAPGPCWIHGVEVA
ncbi:hypothetical protein ABZ837_20515 [Streptomyces sp. NPDC047197]|uniref:hypothetical protein n=1 Tax=Streptomyces sp. NPDC047197 TaxID=3155477 RepID=UPI003402182E